MSKVKIGQKYKSMTSNSIITITSKKSGNGHWNTRKDNSKNNHTIHEGTLNKYWSKV